MKRSVFFLRVSGVAPPPKRAPYLATPTAAEITDVLRKAFPERFAICSVAIECAVTEGTDVRVVVKQ